VALFSSVLLRISKQQIIKLCACFIIISSLFVIYCLVFDVCNYVEHICLCLVYPCCCVCHAVTLLLRLNLLFTRDANVFVTVVVVCCPFPFPLICIIIVIITNSSRTWHARPAEKYLLECPPFLPITPPNQLAWQTLAPTQTRVPHWKVSFRVLPFPSHHTCQPAPVTPSSPTFYSHFPPKTIFFHLPIPFSHTSQPAPRYSPMPYPHPIVPFLFSSLSRFLPEIDGQTDGWTLVAL